MSQYDYGTIDPNVMSGTNLALALNDFRDALHTLHRGASRPSYVKGGMMWLRETSADRWDALLFDGNNDVLIFSINPATGAPINHEVSATGPAVTYAFQRWWDTSGADPVLKLRNGANDGWHTLGAIESGQWVPYSAGESAETRYARLAFANNFTQTPSVNGADVLVDGDVAAALNASGNAPIYACRAWVNFDGTTSPPTIRASGNVSSITKNGVGDYTINFALDMPDEHYSVTIAAREDSHARGTYRAGFSGFTPPTVSSVRIANPIAGLSGEDVDSKYLFVSVFR